MVLPFHVALYSGVSVAALFAAAGADAYAVGGNSPEFVADFAGVLNSGTEYYRSGGSDTTFSSVFTHSGLVAPATMTDSDGVLKWAPHNVLLRSNEFDNSNWSSSNMTETGGQTDPDGGSSAYKLTPTVSSAVHSTFKTTPNSQLLTLTKYAVEVIAKADGYNFLSISMGDVSGGSPYVIFDLSDGTIDAQSAGASGSITPIGSGWYLCTVDDFTGSSAQEIFSVNSTSNPTVDQFGRQSFAGDGSSGVLVYQARSYRSDLGGMVNNPDRGDSYVPTTTAARFLPRRNNYIYNGSTYDNAGILVEPAAATNLFQYSDSLATFPWGVANGTISSNAATGGDGQSTADKLTPNNGSAFCSLTQTVSVSAAVHTISFEAEANGFNFVQVYVTGVGHCNFDLSAGTVGTSSGSWVGQMQEVRNGVYRCSVTTGSLSAGSTTFRFAIPVNASSALGVLATGDGTSGINLWGMQLEQGSVPTSYIPTAGSTVTRAAETLTVAGANLPYSATAMSFNIKFKISFPDTNVAISSNGDDGQFVPILWNDATAEFISIVARSNDVAGARLWSQYKPTYTPINSGVTVAAGINKSFNAATRHTAASGSSISVNGTTAATNATAFTGNLATDTLKFMHVGTNTSRNTSSISIFRMWGTDIGDSGIEEASS